MLVGARSFLVSAARGAKCQVAPAAAAYLVPQRCMAVERKTSGIFPNRRHKGKMKHLHMTEVVPGEQEDGTVSHLPWLGEKDKFAGQDDVQEGDFVGGKSKRVGVIGEKVGMLNVWDARGVRTTLTVVKLENVEVTMINRGWTPQGKKYINLQVGYGSANTRRMRRSMLCQYRSMGVEPKKKLVEFRVDEHGVLPVGTQLTCRHFMPGQCVDVTGITKGKGFQGGMKRWGLKGQPASHGNSLTHRHIGAIGACQDPGKVWPGKKMPGRMGNKRRIQYNSLVYKIDVDRNLLFLKGCIPGKRGGLLEIQDARKKKWHPDNPPPYPTFAEDPNEEPVNELVMDVSHLPNPFSAELESV